MENNSSSLGIQFIVTAIFVAIFWVIIARLAKKNGLSERWFMWPISFVLCGLIGVGIYAYYKNKQQKLFGVNDNE